MSLGRRSPQQHLEVVLGGLHRNSFLKSANFSRRLFDTTFDWLICAGLLSRSSCDIILNVTIYLYPVVSVAFGFKAFKSFEIKKN